ncbi:MAG TPA: imidazole glycerol phosphate synthase subunit HisH [Silvibacterium sp.]|nr:imidazole glycerol phosphate synthase subunit HisH [Silvibacterium sp.]
MIAVVDYKAGNLASVMKALHSLGADAVATDDPEAVRRAKKIVLPGVGHFAATEFLERRGLRQAIAECSSAGTPFLGICVGLQWLFSGSTEAPGCRGLCAFDETCARFGEGRKVPHVGWNSLEITEGSRLMEGIVAGSYVYFTHSYCAPVTQATVAVTNYGEPFTAAIEAGNIMGVQFHPEKSGTAGLRILQNFLEFPESARPC